MVALLKNPSFSFAVKVISFVIYYLVVCDFPTRLYTEKLVYTKIASIKEIRWIRHFYVREFNRIVTALFYASVSIVFSTKMNFNIHFSSADFVETSLEHIKHVHVQLNMNSLKLEKGPSWKRKVGEHARCLTFSRTLFFLLTC